MNIFLQKSYKLWHSIYMIMRTWEQKAQKFDKWQFTITTVYCLKTVTIVLKPIFFQKYMKNFINFFSIFSGQNTLPLDLNELRPKKISKRCQLCPRKRDRKCRNFCQICSSAICGEHTVKSMVCVNCNHKFKCGLSL